MEKYPYRKSGIGDSSPYVPIISAQIYDAMPTIEELEAEERQNRAKRRREDRKFNRAIAIILIFTLVGAPLLGTGVGMGVSLANSYFLPRLLNDAAQRENFAFDNVHTPQTPVGAFESPLLHRQNYVDLVNAVKPSVVTVSVRMPAVGGMLGQLQARTRAGTGIIMYETTSRYYIATNAHVIAGAAEVGISIEGSADIPAIPVGRYDDADLAIIAIYKADAIQAGVYSVVLARFGDSMQSQVGEIVLAIGNAMGEGITVTNGIISALDIVIYVEGLTLDVLQTNAAINRGNSGGPLVNVFGEVIGINTARIAEQLAEGMGYAIPSHVAKPILERIMHEGPAARRPTIGVTIDTEAPTDAGIMVFNVDPGSPAHMAGMQRGDIITHIDGLPINYFEEMVAFMETRSMGDVATFTINRNAEILEKTMTLGEYHRPRF
ncbi:MAG: trypsin-like peptidase domain-containing protein [Clostridiales bacterium]|jgi:serine protease Do|nr:trypsin-like peptidase domain-containing protein [Clostridiales bacterium]